MEDSSDMRKKLYEASESVWHKIKYGKTNYECWRCQPKDLPRKPFIQKISECAYILKQHCQSRQGKWKFTQSIPKNQSNMYCDYTQ